MAYSNSPLVTYTKLSPNYNKRTEKITKITIHHMAGNLSVETCGALFANASRQGSSNYGIGTDGRIAMYVEEKNRAWTSGSSWNDQRAVTIEVANTTEGVKNKTWAISDKAMNSLIALCADICHRNGIKAVDYTGNKNGVITFHCMYQATACPGPYIKSKINYIVDEINKRIGTTPAPEPTPKPETRTTIKELSSYMFNGVDYKPAFSADWYYNNYKDIRDNVAPDAKKLFQHFTTYGMKEPNRRGNSEFNVIVYMNDAGNDDLRSAYGTKMPDCLPKYYEHYCRFGYKEPRTHK